MKKSAILFFCFFSLISLPSFAAVEEDEDCANEILLAYYPSIFVKESLRRFNIPENRWEAIVSSLSDRDKNILKNVEQKASKMSPNPLKDAQQRQVAVKLFRETLYENFATVMMENGVEDPKLIQQLLDDIQKRKAQRFARCMEKERTKKQMSSRDADVEEMNSDDDED